MIGRRQFGVQSLSVAAAAIGTSAFAADDDDRKTERHEHHADDVVSACARACSDCQRECDACSTHCAGLLKDGHEQHAVTLGTCLDCADFCATASQIVSRRGPFAGLICEPCAVACERCAIECERFPDDKHMTACAEECRKCEKACKAMLPHIGHAAR